MGMETAQDTEKRSWLLLLFAGNFHMVIAWGLSQDFFAEGWFSEDPAGLSHSRYHVVEKNQEQPLSYLVPLYQKNNQEVACQKLGVWASISTLPSHLNISQPLKLHFIRYAETQIQFCVYLMPDFTNLHLELTSISIFKSVRCLMS